MVWYLNLGGISQIQKMQDSFIDGRFLTEVIVQDPQQSYRPYIFNCSQWFKGGGCTYKHFIVGPKDHRSSYLRLVVQSGVVCPLSFVFCMLNNWNCFLSVYLIYYLQLKICNVRAMYYYWSAGIKILLQLGFV